MNEENQDDDEFDDDVEYEIDEDFVPRIAILGAGPIGIEAALYARYLGYDVALLDRKRVAHGVLQWGHVRMFSPFSMNRSSLGVAALRAQDENVALPDDDATLTGKEFAEQYLIPLSKSDLLADCVHENVNVLNVGRDGILKSDTHDVDRSQFRFRVLVETSEGENVIEADVVIDTTGVTQQANYVGHGGIPAVGELRCRERFANPLPDILGSERGDFEHKRTLVVGSGYSAATNVVALAELRLQSPDTDVTWMTRRETSPRGPIPLVENDRLPLRSELIASANAADVKHFAQTSVMAIDYDDSSNQFNVTFAGGMNEQQQFDNIIANTGFRPDVRIYDELQIETCPISQAPLALATWLQDVGNVDALDQTSPGHHVLLSREPNFYILGSKSFGRNSNFLLSLGMAQIRDVFSVIAGRDDLDLYKTMDELSS